MMNKQVYEAVDRTFRDIMRSEDELLENRPFGGKGIIVLEGTFDRFYRLYHEGEGLKLLLLL